MHSRRGAAYITVIIAAGGAAFLQAGGTWYIDNWPRYLTFLALALVASRLKVGLPGVDGTMSTSFVFVLLGISEIGLPGTLVMGCAAMATQSLVNTRKRPAPVQVAFNLGSVACSVEAAYRTYDLTGFRGDFQEPIRLLLAAAAYFMVNTLSVATVIALTGGKRPFAVWREAYFWTFPNYLVGAAIAWAVAATSRSIGWQTSILVLPVLYVLYRSHEQHVRSLAEERRRAEEQRAHAKEVRALQRRTVETLALAVEAKDQTTHTHLERVEVYAVEIGKELGLSETELEALRMAALLHDVGKIAIPEYIISKPGRLTPEEFEKMKTHTVVGAEIVEQIRFPYAVAPLVRGHHEKWDGTGYPDGLAGEQIPFGSRILSAVDFLDAMTSDRPYRRAVPAAEAIEMVLREAGKSFDPRVVEVLVRRRRELDEMARRSGRIQARLSTDLKIERGLAPDAGFQSASAVGLVNLHRSLGRMDVADAAARLRAAIEAGGAPAEIVGALRDALDELAPYDAMAIYALHGDCLRLLASDSKAYPGFASAEIPSGGGVSGWVAESGKPILNGDPAAEPGYLEDPVKFGALRSATAVPLEGEDRIVGVLSLYRAEADAFQPEQLDSLQRIGKELVRGIELLRNPNQAGRPIC